MIENPFLSYLKGNSQPLLADGAMGTMLNARGVDFEQCFDGLNLTQPHLVLEVHRAYVQARARILLTNTFGANRFKPAAHGLQEQLVEINQAGVGLARQPAPGSEPAIFVAGDVGPLGVRLAPYGRVSVAQAGGPSWNRSARWPRLAQILS